MIWFILYIVIAAIAVFCLCYGTMWLFDNSSNFALDELWVPVVCGIFWPLLAPIYGAYLAVCWYADRK